MRRLLWILVLVMAPPPLILSQTTAKVISSSQANKYTDSQQVQEGFVKVTGGRVWYRIVGSSDATPLLLLHGGPGMPSDYLKPLEALAKDRPVIFYDQLGCGRSDRPADKSLWRIERFVEELRQVRKALGLKRVHLLGHSWGTMLATDYMLTRPTGVVSLILASPALSVERWLSDAKTLRSALPRDIQETLARNERSGTTSSKEYKAATDVYMRRHFCRLQPYPREIIDAGAKFGVQEYETMWGPSEFYCTGNLKNYERAGHLQEINMPTLFTCGRYDEATPAATAWYQSLVPKSKLVVFENSAHMTMNEEPDRYVQVLRDFLKQVEHQ